MNYKVLRTVRVLISLIVLVFFSFLFVDFTFSLPQGLVNGMLSLQFVPSLLKFITLVSFSALGFVLITILTLLFGRVYCSTLCPLGVLQDVFSFISRTLRRKKRRMKYRRPQNFLRYAILLVAAALLVSGTAFAFSLLDPYSIFGKIGANLFRPVYYGLNNLGASVARWADSYLLFPVTFKNTGLFAVLFSAFLLALLVVMAGLRGRLYCNTICPVGAFLGLVSKISLFRIRLNSGICTGCGICSSVCKAECIDPKSRKVDFSRCVVCLNCLRVCPHDGIDFQFSFVKTKARVAEPEGRRLFLRSFAVAPAALFSFVPQGQRQRNGRIEASPEHSAPVAPPGAGSISAFTSACTACYLCVTVCPSKVIQPSFMEYGLAGMMMPKMDYHTGFCNFECTLCGEVCPTGALLPLPKETKKLTQIGKAWFIKETCIVHTDGTDCGACSEHCPTKAVQMVPYRGSLYLPRVKRNICIGCGACEYACPTEPKSIFVEGNAVHRLARKPVVKPIDIQITEDDDFPF